MRELFGTEHDVVEGLKKAVSALALGHEFLLRATEEDDEGGMASDVWELNRDAFVGLGHILFELRNALTEMRENVMKSSMEAHADRFTEKLSASDAPRVKTGDDAVSWLREQMREKLDVAINDPALSINVLGDIAMFLDQVRKLKRVPAMDAERTEPT